MKVTEDRKLRRQKNLNEEEKNLEDRLASFRKSLVDSPELCAKVRSRADASTKPVCV